MAWKEGDPLPYDGWYNGNTDLMIINGTYEYFRPKLELMAKYGFFGEPRAEEKARVEEGMQLLAEWDAKWDEVPDEEKERRFGVVLEDTTPKIEIRQTDKGMKKVVKQRPSDNNNAELERSRPKKKVVHKSLRGIFSSEDKPKRKVRPISSPRNQS